MFVLRLANRLNAGFILAVAITMPYLWTATVTAQTTANYIGPNNGLWSDPNNWDIGQVPINSKDGTFNVILPNNTTIHIDVIGNNEITGFIHPASTTLMVSDSRSIDIVGAATLGSATVSGVGSLYQSISGLSSINNNARFMATNGGVVRSTAGSYTGGVGQGTLEAMQAIGQDSVIDFSSISTFSASGGGNSGGTVRVRAIDGGFIDLSHCVTMHFSNTGFAGGILRIVMEGDSYIDLSRLESITSSGSSGRPEFTVNIPEYTLESLSSASARFDVGSNSLCDLPVLTTLTNGWLRMNGGGTINAPQLSNFTNSRLILSGDDTFNAPPFASIGNASFTLGTGAQYAVSAGSYNLSIGQGTLEAVRVTDAGSILDLSSVTSMTTSAGANGGGTVLLEAVAGGVIDMSGVSSIVHTPSGFAGGTLLIRYNSGGHIKLDSLESVVAQGGVSGNVRFDLTGGVMELPELNTMSRVIMNLGVFTGVNMPVLQTANAATLNLSLGSVINAPILESLTSSNLSLAIGESFNAPVLSNINNTRITLVDGATLSLGVTEYLYSQNNSQDVFLVTNAGSTLDLPQLETLVFSTNSSPSIRATGLGRILLPSANRLEGSFGSGSNVPSVRAQAGGRVEFGQLLEVYGRIRLDVDGASAMLSLPGGLTLASLDSRLRMLEGGRASVGGDLVFHASAESHIDTRDGILHMNGTASTAINAQRLEVAGADLGLPVGNIPLNFQIGQLIIGDHDQSTFVRLVDTIDNGNRGPNGEPELLYLQGFPASNGLNIRGGSTLILDQGIQLYAVIGNEWTHINSLFSENVNQIPFDDGFIVRIKLGDLNGDGVVNVSDLLILLGAWGMCEDLDDCPADLNGDGVVNVSDLLILLANWG